MAMDEGLCALWCNSGVISRADLDASIIDPDNPPMTAPEYVVENVCHHRYQDLWVNHDESLPEAERVMAAGGPNSVA
jgi:hypothetical protein